MGCPRNFSILVEAAKTGFICILPLGACIRVLVAGSLAHCTGSKGHAVAIPDTAGDSGERDNCDSTAQSDIAGAATNETILK